MTPQSFDTSHIESFIPAYKRDFDKYYLHFHKYRYVILLNLIRDIQQNSQEASLRILDVGPMFQTNMIRDTFQGSKVNTLGYHWKRNQMTGQEYHVEVNLNETDNISPQTYQQNHIVTCAEVIEHLYTRPQKVIPFLGQFLKQDGYLIIQTPNGVSLDRRYNMIMGRNPYDMINEKRINHYREYTIQELKDILKECNFTIQHASTTNYFNPDKTMGQKMFRKLSPIIPKNLRQGITIVAQKNN